MCIQNKLQHKIAILTNDGEDILRFLAQTMRGEIPGAQACHRLEASRQLNRLNALSDHAADNTPSPLTGEGWGGGESSHDLARPEPVEAQDHAADNTPSPLTGEGRGGGESSHDPARPEPVEAQDHAADNTPSPLMGEGRGGGESSHDLARPEPVEGPTLYDIVAYPIARYIRDRTNEGETMVYALYDVIHDNGEYDIEAAMGIRGSMARPPAKPHHKLAAANEIIRRALGETTRRRKSSAYDPEADIDETDPLNGHLAKLVRDKTADGTEAAEMLIRIAENDRKMGEWTSAHRVSAARELMHRAYDLNYDAVTWEQVEAYKRATDFADEGESLERTRIQNGRDALLREFNEAYESGDEEATRRAEEKYKAYNRCISEGKDPEEAMRYACADPSDPDPYNEQDKMYAEIHRYRRLAAQDDASDNRTVAATIRAPKLTIPLNNRSP